jgi:lincosamide nucleotidyltransferase A/C/D/E
MSATDVVAFLDLAESYGITVWVDGGWAVDACLGRQTRQHGDLDIVVTEPQHAALVAALRDRGYADVPRADTRPWNFVLGDADGHHVDFHVIAMDENGDGVYGPPANGEVYVAEALTGTGVIGGRTVACITPEWQVRFHTGYPPDADDWADVSALCERFGIDVPPDYAAFVSAAAGPITPRPVTRDKTS